MKSPKGTTFWVKSEGFAIEQFIMKGKALRVSKTNYFTNSNNPMCAYTRFNTKVGVNEEGSRELGKLVISLFFHILNLFL